MLACRLLCPLQPLSRLNCFWFGCVSLVHGQKYTLHSLDDHPRAFYHSCSSSSLTWPQRSLHKKLHQRQKHVQKQSTVDFNDDLITNNSSGSSSQKRLSSGVSTSEDAVNESTVSGEAVVQQPTSTAASSKKRPKAKKAKSTKAASPKS